MLQKVYFKRSEIHKVSQIAPKKLRIDIQQFGIPKQLMCTCFNFQLVSLLKNLPRYFIPYFSDCANSHIKKEIDIYDYFQFK